MLIRTSAITILEIFCKIILVKILVKSILYPDNIFWRNSVSINGLNTQSWEFMVVAIWLENLWKTEIVNSHNIFSIGLLIWSFFHVPGSVCSLWFQGALPESIRAQTQLQRPRCHQVGSLHRKERTIRNSLLSRVRD